MPTVKNQVERPPDTPFRQQRLPAWQPILTPRWVIVTFVALGLVFIPIGLVVVSISGFVVEVVQRYDDLCPEPPSDCTINVTIPNEMRPPIYFYYQLTNFYQNHRRYVKSRSDAQLRGVGDLSETDLANCDPMVTSPAEPKKVMYPCGLIANSFFTDQFNATVFEPSTVNGTLLSGVDWDRKGIAWSTDVQQKFKKPRRSYDGVSRSSALTPQIVVVVADRLLPRYTIRPGIGTILLPEVVDEELIVWMRTAGMPTFKKLNRIIGQRALPAGALVQVHINNQFPVTGFQGHKAIVLSTTSVLGGKNPFLGYAYIIVGALALAMASLFMAKHYHSPRTLGDMSYIHWNLTDKRVHPEGTGASSVSRPIEPGVSEHGPKSVGDDK